MLVLIDFEKNMYGQSWATGGSLSTPLSTSFEYILKRYHYFWALNDLAVTR